MSHDIRSLPQSLARLRRAFEPSALLNHMGVAPAGRPGMPDPCPLCRLPGLLIDHDTARGGGWFRCLRCGWSGDGPGLLERWSGLPLDQAVRSFLEQQRGIDIGAMKVEFFDTWRHEERRRQAALTFWQDCRKFDGTFERSQLRDLCANLGLRGSPYEERSVVQRLCGVATIAEFRRRVDFVDEVRLPTPATVTWLTARPECRRMSDTVMVLPVLDMPERLCGFVFVGIQLSQIWCRVSLLWPGGGLCGAESLVLEPNQTPIVAPDVNEMLRGQFSQAARGDLAPLVCFAGVVQHPGRLGQGMLAGRKPIVAVGDDPVTALACCRGADGLLLDRQTWGKARQALNTRPLKVAVNEITKLATGWKARFESAVDDGTTEQVKALWAGMQTAAGDWPDALENMSEATAAKLRTAISPDGNRPATVADMTLYERRDGVYREIAGKGQRVANFRIRIDELISCDDVDAIYVRGRILVDDVSREFRTPAAKLTATITNTAQAILAERGQITHIDYRLVRILPQVAQAFSTIRHLAAHRAIGYSAREQSILLPTLTIDRHGQLASESKLLFPDECRYGRLQYRKLNARDTDLLSDDSTAVRAGWAAVRHLAECVAATHVGGRRLNLAFGADPAFGAALWRAVGVTAEEYNLSAWPHCWPMTSSRWHAASEQDDWRVFIADETKTLLAAINPGWRACQTDEVDLVDPDFAESLAAATVDYLCYLAGRGYQFADGVVLDMARWWKLRGGIMPPMLPLIARSEAAILLLQAARRLHGEQWFKASKRRALIDLPLLHRKLTSGRPICSAAGFAAALRQVGVEASCRSESGIGAFSVDRKWFDKLATYKARTSASVQSSSKSVP